MLLLVSLQWDRATGANRRWLQQEPEAGISVAFTGGASVYPASRQVRMSEVRSGVSRVAGPRAAIPCRRWVRGSDLCKRRCGRAATFLTPCPIGCSMLLLVSLLWDSATGANRRWLQQEPEAGISVAFTGEATGRHSLFSLISRT